MLGRRESLALLASLALTPLVRAATDVAPERSADAWTRTPEGLLHTLMKLRAALDDRMTLEWFQGVVYGVVDSAMVPLFTVNAVAFAHYRLAEDGSFRGRRAEVTYHTALGDTQVLESFRNPYSGALVDVPILLIPAYHPPPARSVT